MDDGIATTDVWLRHSHDGGQTWEPEQHLHGPFDHYQAPISYFAPGDPRGLFLGDYVGLETISGNDVIAFFTSTTLTGPTSTPFGFSIRSFRTEGIAARRRAVISGQGATWARSEASPTARHRSHLPEGPSEVPASADSSKRSRRPNGVRGGPAAGTAARGVPQPER